MTPITYYKNAEAPSLRLWWFGDDGDLVDLSTVSAWSLKVGQYGDTAVLTKTSGITGAAGSGTDPTGTPNVTIAWSAGELNITAGHYALQLTATTASGPRVLTAPFRVYDTIT